jgi:hypothetical protein
MTLTAREMEIARAAFYAGCATDCEANDWMQQGWADYAKTLEEQEAKQEQQLPEALIKHSEKSAFVWDRVTNEQWHQEHDRLMLEEVERRIRAEFDPIIEKIETAIEDGNRVEKHLEQRIIERVAKAARGVEDYCFRDFAEELEKK